MLLTSDLETALLSGSIGLVGVVVGATVTSVVQWKMYVRRELLDVRQAERAATKRVRSGARVLRGQLEFIAESVDLTRNGYPTPIRDDVALAASWATYQDVLAAEIEDDHEWEGIEGGVASALIAISVVEDERALDYRPLGEGALTKREQLKLLMADIALGAETLDSILLSLPSAPAAQGEEVSSTVSS